MSLSLKVSRKVVRRVGIAVLAAGCAAGLLVWVGATHRAAAVGTAVNLGDAGSYAVLASGTVTGSATSSMTGDVGGSTVDGANEQVAGVVRTGRSTAQALADLGEAADTIASNVATATLPRAGGTLGPGVYLVSGALDVPGSLTLDAGGDADATFIVRTASTFTTGDGTRIALAGGARACHVFWMADDSATVDGTVVGTVVAGTGIAARDGAAVTGRLLSKTGDVTLDRATVRVPTDCSGAPTVPPGPAPNPPPAPAPAPGTGAGAAAAALAVTGGSLAPHAAPARAGGVPGGHARPATEGAADTGARAGTGTAGAHHASSSRTTAAATGGTHRAADRTDRATAPVAAVPRAPVRGARSDDASSGAGRRDSGAAAAAEDVIRSKLGALGDVAS